MPGDCGTLREFGSVDTSRGRKHIPPNLGVRSLHDPGLGRMRLFSSRDGAAARRFGRCLHGSLQHRLLHCPPGRCPFSETCAVGGVYRGHVRHPLAPARLLSAFRAIGGFGMRQVGTGPEGTPHPAAYHLGGKHDGRCRVGRQLSSCSPSCCICVEASTVPCSGSASRS